MPPPPPASTQAPAANLNAPSAPATRVGAPAAPPGPTTAPPQKRPLWVLGTVAAVVVALVVVGVLALGGDDGTTPDAGDTTVSLGSANTSGDGGTVAPNTTVAPDTTVASDTTVTSDTTSTNAAAAATLAETATGDNVAADELVGTYVVQFAARYAGLSVDGSMYDAQAILDEHYLLRSVHNAILVSGYQYNFQFESAPASEWYLTILVQQFTSETAANQWCADAGLTDCVGRFFQPRIAALENRTCNEGGEPCVGISSARWFDGTLYVTYHVSGFEPLNSGVSGDTHVHFFFNTQARESVGVPGDGLWYVWDRAAGGGEFVFTGFTVANMFDYGYETGAQVCITPAQHDHSLVDSTIYWCEPVPEPGGE